MLKEGGGDKNKHEKSAPLDDIGVLKKGFQGVLSDDNSDIKPVVDMSSLASTCSTIADNLEGLDPDLLQLAFGIVGQDQEIIS